MLKFDQLTEYYKTKTFLENLCIMATSSKPLLTFWKWHVTPDWILFVSWEYDVLQDLSQDHQKYVSTQVLDSCKFYRGVNKNGKVPENQSNYLYVMNLFDKYFS